jgi:hypothetical protein
MHSHVLQFEIKSSMISATFGLEKKPITRISGPNLVRKWEIFVRMLKKGSILPDQIEKRKRRCVALSDEELECENVLHFRTKFGPEIRVCSDIYSKSL